MMTDFSDFRMGSEFVLGSYLPGSVSPKTNQWSERIDRPSRHPQQSTLCMAWFCPKTLTSLRRHPQQSTLCMAQTSFRSDESYSSRRLSTLFRDRDMQIYISYSLFSPYIYVLVCVYTSTPFPLEWRAAVACSLPLLVRGRPLSIFSSLLVTTMTPNTKQSLAIDAKKFLVTHGF
jgi:hypothetical protein